jgi:uncharacterized protein YndB with AHSA1/START domain
MAPRTLAIEHTYYLEAPPSKVFEALATPEGLSGWFLQSAKIEPKAGSEYTFTWQGGYKHTARVLAAVPGRRLVLGWPNRVGRTTRTTVVSFTLHKKGKGTRLELRHEGYPATGSWLEVYGATQSGWAYFLTNLKSVLATGRDLRSDHDAV